MKPRKTPVRTCVGCREATGKRELVRVVRKSDGETTVDPSGKMNGRGAYLCARLECFEAAVKRGRLAAALHTVLKEDDIERLRREFERAIGS